MPQLWSSRSESRLVSVGPVLLQRGLPILIMNEKPKYPWRLATNERYREVVRTLMGLSTASLLLPVLFAREFLGIDGKTPLKHVIGATVYCSWVLLGISIVFGLAFHYLSAKWVRLAWGRNAGIWGFPTNEKIVERALDFFFWATAVTFASGLGFAVAFLYGW